MAIDGASAIRRTCSLTMVSEKNTNIAIETNWCYNNKFKLTKTKKYEKLSSQEQVIFLSEAEKVFSAFEKVPDLLWEEEYNKYMEVLNKYKDIRMVRWTSN